jgi:hypothetical protein
LTSALEGGDCSVSRPGRFTPRERAPGTHSIGGGGSRSWSGHGGEEKNSQPLLGVEPPIIQPAAQRYTTELSWLLVIIKMCEKRQEKTARLKRVTNIKAKIKNILKVRLLFA